MVHFVFKEDRRRGCGIPAWDPRSVDLVSGSKFCLHGAEQVWKPVQMTQQMLEMESIQKESEAASPSFLPLVGLPLILGKQGTYYNSIEKLPTKSPRPSK